MRHPADRLTDEQYDRFDSDPADDEFEDDPTAYDLPMTGATYLRPGERRDLA